MPANGVLRPLLPAFQQGLKQRDGSIDPLESRSALLLENGDTRLCRRQIVHQLVALPLQVSDRLGRADAAAGLFFACSGRLTAPLPPLALYHAAPVTCRVPQRRSSSPLAGAAER